MILTNFRSQLLIKRKEQEVKEQRKKERELKRTKKRMEELDWDLSHTKEIEEKEKKSAIETQTFEIEELCSSISINSNERSFEYSETSQMEDFIFEFKLK